MKTFIVFAISLAFLSAFLIQLSSGISDRQELVSEPTNTAQTPNVTAGRWFDIFVDIFTWLKTTIAEIISYFSRPDFDYTINEILRFLVTTNTTLSNPTLNVSTFSNVVQLSKTRKTVFLVHGYLDNANSYVRTIESRLLYDQQFKGEIQTVFVDWSVTASGEYPTVVSKLPGVGRAIAAFAKNQGLNVEENVQCIGHSLGSHVCGFFGKALQEDFGEKLARISGLDPAGPLFSLDAPRYRLDKSDAQWVDVIHTDAQDGTTDPFGHQDFYANGGDNQPGCSDTLCDHLRAIFLYEDSMGCSFGATFCGENVVPDNNTSCSTDQFALMGYNNIGPNNPYENSPEGSYYLETKAEAPYCFQK